MSKLMVLTLAELSNFIVEQLDMDRVLLKPFPACDFGIVELNRDEVRTKLTEEELDDLHSEVREWYGLKSFKTGFDDIDLSIAADYYGGGCTAFVQLKDGMSDEEAGKVLLTALYSCLEHNEHINSSTLLIVERLMI